MPAPLPGAPYPAAMPDSGTLPGAIPDIPHRQLTIPSGLEGVRVTLKLMVALARQYKTTPLIRETAKQVTQVCPERDQNCEIAMLHGFVRDGIRYVKDIHEVETLQTPVNTLKTRAGDCDDKCTLLAAMLLSVGIPGAFCAVGVQGGFYSHVLVQAILRQRNKIEYVPLECIVSDAFPGWFPPDATCMMLAHFG